MNVKDTYIYKSYVKGMVICTAIIFFSGVINMSFAQTQSSNSQSKYIPVKTKQDIAIERQKKSEENAKVENQEIGKTQMNETHGTQVLKSSAREQYIKTDNTADNNPDIYIYKKEEKNSVKPIVSDDKIDEKQ